MRILISAGEASGDMHAAAVIKSLKANPNHSETFGITGPAMKNAGCQTLIDMEQLNVMGVSDVLRSLPRIRRVRNEMLEWANRRTNWHVFCHLSLNGSGIEVLPLTMSEIRVLLHVHRDGTGRNSGNIWDFLRIRLSSQSCRAVVLQNYRIMCRCLRNRGRSFNNNVRMRAVLSRWRLVWTESCWNR